MRTATFSTGETFTRVTHTRDYKFAWAIVRDGKVQAHGFSTTREGAQKTASSNLSGWRCDNPAGLVRRYGLSYTRSAEGKAHFANCRTRWASATTEVVPAWNYEEIR